MNTNDLLSLETDQARRETLQCLLSTDQELAKLEIAVRKLQRTNKPSYPTHVIYQMSALEMHLARAGEHLGKVRNALRIIADARVVGEE